MGIKSTTGTNLLTGAAVGILQVGMAISLATLIFSGALSDGAGRAAAGFVLGTAISAAIVGSMSNMSVVVSGAQDTGAIIIAAGGAAVVASSDITATEHVPTVIVMLAIATVASGLIFWVLGHYGKTSFVRYLPFPVVSGFTAGTAWLLVRGGVEVMLDRSLSLGTVDDLVSSPESKFLLPGLGLALIIVVVVRTRLTNTLVSVAILAGAIGFHVIGRSASSLTELEDNGWLIGPFSEGAGWAPVGPSDLTGANWTVLFDNGLTIVAAVAVSVIGMLLNLSGLEGDPDPQIDMNNEMQAAGIANVLSGIGSGSIGYHQLGDTTLSRQLGARGRIVPVLIAAIAAASFFVGVGVIGLVPRSVAGGVLIGVGLTMFADWLDSLSTTSKSDSLLSALILVTIAALGVLAGVGAGVVIAAAVFIVKYGRINPVRHVVDAAGRSNVDRDDRGRQVLADSSGSIVAFELQGYLFFGSTTQLQRQIDEEVVALAPSTPTKFVILDCARVTGIDSTAAGGLRTITNKLGGQGVTTIWTSVHGSVEPEFRLADLPTTHIHRDLDHAIAWCEDQIIAEFDGDGPAPGESFGPASTNDLFDLVDLPRQALEIGEALIEVGATDRDLYFVESGTLTAWIPNQAGELFRIRQVLPGAALGEIAFCNGEARSATVIADTPAVVRVLERERFDELVEAEPGVAIAIQQELLRRLSLRLSTTSAMVRDLLR